MNVPKIPTEWKKWCSTGQHAGLAKRNAVHKCLNSKGRVVGYFSDLLLDPDLDYTDSMYPSVEHLGDKNDKDNVAVETRIINDMKSHLSEKEFWRVISHLFFVGIRKGKIKASPSDKCLPIGWRPAKNFDGNK